MIVIRTSQMDGLDRRRRAAFDAKVADSLREAWADRVELLGDRYLAFVHSAIDAAYSHGFTDDIDASRFVNLTLLWGMGFEENPAYPWAKEIATDPSLPAGLRVQNLYERSELEVGAVMATVEAG